jgi:hypothetical protein
MDFGDLGCWDMDGIDIARDRDKWLALVNAVVNLQVLHNAGNLSSN